MPDAAYRMIEEQTPGAKGVRLCARACGRSQDENGVCQDEDVPRTTEEPNARNPFTLNSAANDTDTTVRYSPDDTKATVVHRNGFPIVYVLGGIGCFLVAIVAVYLARKRQMQGMASYGTTKDIELSNNANVHAVKQTIDYGYSHPNPVADKSWVRYFDSGSGKFYLSDGIQTKWEETDTYNTYSTGMY